MQAQVGALLLQIVACGAARVGSSKVPARMKIKCGRTSASLDTWVPQVGQKRQCNTLPLSAVMGKSDNGPEMVTSFL